MSRGGFGSKVHVLTDGRGHVLQAVVTRGNRNECPVVGPLVGSVARREGRWPDRLAADKGYSSDRIRGWLAARRVDAVIPMRHNEHVADRPPFDAAAYRGRNVVERCVAKLKEFRRIATRYEKLAGNYLAMLTLATTVLYLRLLDSPDRP
jgi:transposase